MITKNIPYIYLDDDIDYNATLLILILDELAINSRKRYKLNFDKIQLFIYLVKNPANINRILEISGKKPKITNKEILFTIESQSLNIDILHDRSKVTTLLMKLISKEYVSFTNDDSNGFSYFLTKREKTSPKTLILHIFL